MIGDWDVALVMLGLLWLVLVCVVLMLVVTILLVIGLLILGLINRIRGLPPKRSAAVIGSQQPIERGWVVKVNRELKGRIRGE